MSTGSWYSQQWNQAPGVPQMSPNYGSNLHGIGVTGARGGGWATGNQEVDKYIGALDSALKNQRVGGATQMARDLEWAQRMASGGAGAGAPPSIGNLPDFGSSSGAVGGSATLRANPYEARLNSLLDNPDAIANTGAYKFALGQGQQALERSAAAKGMTGSGNTLAALLQYGQGMASQQYGKEADRLANLVQGRDQTNANLYGTDVGAATSRYGTDVGSKTSMWNTAQRINAENYWNAQKQNAPSYGSPMTAGTTTTMGRFLGGGGDQAATTQRIQASSQPYYDNLYARQSQLQRGLGR